MEETDEAEAEADDQEVTSSSRNVLKTVAWVKQEFWRSLNKILYT